LWARELRKVPSEKGPGGVVQKSGGDFVLSDVSAAPAEPDSSVTSLET
jgi:hypothetical protein